MELLPVVAMIMMKCLQQTPKEGGFVMQMMETYKTLIQIRQGEIKKEILTAKVDVAKEVFLLVIVLTKILSFLL